MVLQGRIKKLKPVKLHNQIQISPGQTPPCGRCCGVTGSMLDFRQKVQV